MNTRHIVVMLALTIVILGMVLTLYAVFEEFAQPPFPGAERMMRTELYFGMSIAGGDSVTVADWQTFLSDDVTPLFPDGFTVVAAQGQWQSESDIIRENSRLLILIHPPDPETEADIQQIIRAYKTEFDQQAVLRASAQVWIAF